MLAKEIFLVASNMIIVIEPPGGTDSILIMETHILM